jgi:hypothetical protein
MLRRQNYTSQIFVDLDKIFVDLDKLYSVNFGSLFRSRLQLQDIAYFDVLGLVK